MVAPDSGFFHLAGAQGIPTLGLFGPTNGALTGKHYPRAEHLTASPLGLRCRPPCYRCSERGFREDCGNEGCQVLHAITVDMVGDALVRMGLSRHGA